MPQFLRDEWHQRMQQKQGLPEDGLDPTPIPSGLLQFDIPIAEIVPDEMPDGLRSIVIAECFYRLAHLARALVQARPDPSVLYLKRALGGRFSHVCEDEAGGIPDFVGESTGAIEAVG